MSVQQPQIATQPGKQAPFPGVGPLSQATESREPVFLPRAVHMPLTQQHQFRDIRKRSATMRFPQKNAVVPTIAQLKSLAPRASPSPPPFVHTNDASSETTSRGIGEFQSQDFRQLPRKEFGLRSQESFQSSAPILIASVPTLRTSSTQSSPSSSSSSFCSQSPGGHSIDERLKALAGTQNSLFAPASRNQSSPSPTPQKGSNFSEAKSKLEGSLNLLAKAPESNAGKAKVAELSKQEKAKQKALKEEEKKRKKQEEKERKEKEKEEKKKANGEISVSLPVPFSQASKPQPQNSPDKGTEDDHTISVNLNPATSYYVASQETNGNEKETHLFNVLSEILFSERSFTTDLWMIIQYYYEPMVSSNELKNFVPIIFSNIVRLHDAATKILKKFESVLANLSLQNFVMPNIGSVFMEIDEKVYTEYCMNQNVSRDAVILLEGIPELKPFFLEHRYNNLDLNSQLIKPVQKICKYPLLLREIIKYYDGPEKQSIEKAMEKCETMLANINGEIESHRRAEEIKKELIGTSLDLDFILSVYFKLSKSTVLSEEELEFFVKKKRKTVHVTFLSTGLYFDIKKKYYIKYEDTTVEFLKGPELESLPTGLTGIKVSAPELTFIILVKDYENALPMFKRLGGKVEQSLESLMMKCIEETRLTKDGQASESSPCPSSLSIDSTDSREAAINVKAPPQILPPSDKSTEIPSTLPPFQFDEPPAPPETASLPPPPPPPLEPLPPCPQICAAESRIPQQPSSVGRNQCTSPLESSVAPPESAPVVIVPPPPPPSTSLPALPSNASASCPQISSDAKHASTPRITTEIRPRRPLPRLPQEVTQIRAGQASSNVRHQNIQSPSSAPFRSMNGTSTGAPRQKRELPQLNKQVNGINGTATIQQQQQQQQQFCQNQSH